MAAASSTSSSSGHATILVILNTILLGIMMTCFDGAIATAVASPPLYVCNRQVDATITPCVKEIADSLITKDPRYHRRTKQCRVNATATVHAAAYCYNIDYLPHCRLCLKRATEKMIGGCGDRVGAQFNDTYCAVRYEVYPFF